MTVFGRNPFGIGPFGLPIKPKVFISYHHGNDQAYYERFNQLFGEIYDLFKDESVDRFIGRNDVEYQRNRIRDEYITGTSLTVVLCGTESYKRKFIDWEICATLNKNHGLLGINLPTNPRTIKNGYIVPGRLHDNIQSGYADYILWTEDPTVIKIALDDARLRSKDTRLIKNMRQTMTRNSS